MAEEKKNWTKEILISIIGAMAIVIAALLSNYQNVREIWSPKTPMTESEIEDNLREKLLPIFQGTDLNPEIFEGFIEGIDAVNDGKLVLYFHYRSYTDYLNYVNISLPENEEVYFSVICDETDKVFFLSIIFEDEDIASQQLKINSKTILSYIPDYPVHAISITLSDDNILTNYGFLISN